MCHRSIIRSTERKLLVHNDKKLHQHLPKNFVINSRVPSAGTLSVNYFHMHTPFIYRAFLKLQFGLYLAMCICKFPCPLFLGLRYFSVSKITCYTPVMFCPRGICFAMVSELISIYALPVLQGCWKPYKSSLRSFVKMHMKYWCFFIHYTSLLLFSLKTFTCFFFVCHLF